jgi:hypothetical protein
MKDTSHKILQVANRKTSVKLTVEFTKEIDNALDKVIESLPKTDGVSVTKENVIVAATENYLEIMRRDENKRSKVKKPNGEKSEKTSPMAKQESLLDLENAVS